MVYVTALHICWRAKKSVILFTYSFCIFECVEVLSKVVHSWTEAGNHGGTSIAPQGVLQKSGDLRLTVGDM